MFGGGGDGRSLDAGSLMGLITQGHPGLGRRLFLCGLQVANGVGWLRWPSTLRELVEATTRMQTLDPS